MVVVLAGRCFLHLESPIRRVCGYDTPFPLAYEQVCGRASVYAIVVVWMGRWMDVFEYVFVLFGVVTDGLSVGVYMCS